MSATVTIPRGAELCHLPSPFALGDRDAPHGDARGASLHAPVLAYERQGDRDLPVVVVLGGISANRHVSAHAHQPHVGWWQGVVGHGGAGTEVGIDANRFQVLSFDWLGGNGNSTGPANSSSSPFPDIGSHDQARALWALCDALRIDSLHAIVGSSYGGMVAQHAARQQPHRCERLVAIAAADRSHAQARAWRHLQRSIVELGRGTGTGTGTGIGIGTASGNGSGNGTGTASGTGCEALALARALAMSGYRSPDELQQRFGGEGQDPDALASWLDARGRAFAKQWHVEEFLCLNRSIDRHRIDAREIPVATWLLAFDSDQLVPAADVRNFALRLPNLRGHRQRRSLYGHDAFLKEASAVSSFLREALR